MSQNSELRVPYGLSVHGEEEIEAVVEVLRTSTQMSKNVLSFEKSIAELFAKDYGVLLVDGPLSGITARAVIVIDKDNKIIHSELVNEIANEPNYDDALNCIL